MKKALFLFLLSFLIMSADELPLFVQKQIKTYYSQNRTYFNRPIGWGTGIYKSTQNSNQFVWFAYSNSDGLLQFEINQRLQNSKIMELGEIKDTHQRKWEVRQHEQYTWIGTTNEWAEKYCSFSRKTVCKYKQALNEIISIINKKEFVKLSVSGYLK